MAKALLFKNTWPADSERSTAEVNLGLFPNHQTTKAVVESANESTDEELFRLCENAGYAKILKIGEFLQTSPARNSAGMLSILCGEAGNPTSEEGGQ